MRVKTWFSGVACFLALYSFPVQAGTWGFADEASTAWDAVHVNGFMAVETRHFIQPAQHTGQRDTPEGSIVIQPELRYKTDSNRHRFSFIPFYRHDFRDRERTHFDVREGYWLWMGDKWEVLTGINKVFWGVTESRHLVNVINQVDGVEDIDGEDYLGQPMIEVTTQRDWGRLSAYVLPGFRPRTFPGVDGRLRSALPVDNDNPQYEDDLSNKHVDFALRYSHYFGNWDVGLSHFYGLGREPRFIVNGGATRLLPVYELINQTGIDVQYTNEAWLWKFEAIGREGHGDLFGAAVGGVEYTFYQLFDYAWDMGILAEYQYDGRDETAPPTGADNDVFSGLRLTLNDTQDTEILAGVSYDPETQEAFYNFEARRRFGQHLVGEFRARGFSDVEDPTIPSAAFAEDDYMQLRLSRYF